MDSIPTAPAETGFPTQNRFADASLFWSRLHRYQLLLRKHWWVMPFCVCLVLFPVGYWALTSPPFYETRGRMWMAGKLNLAEGKLFNEELSTFLGTQAELLRSSTIRGRAIEELKLMSQTQKQKWSSLSLSNDSFMSSFKLDVRENLKTAIIDLRATGPEPTITQTYLNQIMMQYMDFRREVREKTSDTTLEKISEQVKLLQTELAEKQAKLHAFQTSNNVVFLQEQGSSASSLLSKIERQRADMATELNLLSMVTPDQLTEIATRPNSYNINDTTTSSSSAREFLSAMTTPQAEYNKAAQQIQLLEAKKERLSKYLRPIHPKITKLDEDITTQKQLVEVFKKQSVEKLQQRRDALKIQLQNMDAASKEYEAKALATSAKMSEYNIIQQEVLRVQTLYDKLASLIQNVDVNKKIDQETVRIMENASAPLMVRGTVKKMLLGFVAGIILGLVCLYLIELFDDRFSSIGELRNQLTEIVIGQIPEMSSSQLDKGGYLVRPHDDRRVFVESFRNIRSSILFTFSEEERPKTLLITGSVPEEGKTTVSANLALTLALSGSKVVLIDADLRRDSVHKIFQIRPKPGLAEILSQGLDFRQAIVTVDVPNLHIIPAGDAEANPGELFLGQSTVDFIKEIRNHYDYVIFDSPPVLATDDTTSLAPILDGVLFVVRGSFTSARMARESLNLLHQRKVNVLGVIFNRAATSIGEYYYYYRYNSYYHKSKPREKAVKALATTISGDSSKEETNKQS